MRDYGIADVLPTLQLEKYAVDLRQRDTSERVATNRRTYGGERETNDKR